MKTIIYYSTIFFMFLMALLISCNKEHNDSSTGIINGKVTYYSSCKQNKSATLESEHSSSESCITYSYDIQRNILILKHINTGFNCCPGELYCETEISGDTIIINEKEKAALCRCNCLFDLDIKLTSVEAKEYIIKIVEPYCCEQEKLIFNIDLSSFTDGEFCVERENYPWE